MHARTSNKETGHDALTDLDKFETPRGKRNFEIRRFRYKEHSLYAYRQGEGICKGLFRVYKHCEQGDRALRALREEPNKSLRRPLPPPSLPLSPGRRATFLVSALSREDYAVRACNYKEARTLGVHVTDVEASSGTSLIKTPFACEGVNLAGARGISRGGPLYKAPLTARLARSFPFPRYSTQQREHSD